MPICDKCKQPADDLQRLKIETRASGPGDASKEAGIVNIRYDLCKTCIFKANEIALNIFYMF